LSIRLLCLLQSGQTAIKLKADAVCRVIHRAFHRRCCCRPDSGAVLARTAPGTTRGIDRRV
jgi:hypothetical protein